MTRSSLMRLVAVAAFGLLAARAESATVAEIANYKGADRQAVLEAGAKKEGALLIYSVGTQIDPVVKAFGEKYPYIRTSLNRNDATTVARKIIEEYQAGVHQGDGFELSSTGLLAIKQSGLLQPYSTPEAAMFEATAIEQNRLWVSNRESYGGIGYNTKEMPPAEAPKTWADLLNPKYKGKMGITSSASTAGNWTGVLVLAYGEDFIRKLGGQDIRLFNITSRAVADLNVSGELPISARASNAHMAESAAQGAAVAWVDPGPVAVSDNGVALLKEAPHPHAMMLMIDFALSQEGQKLYGKLGYDSARKDTLGKANPKEKVYLEHRPTYLEDFEKWVALFNNVFKKKA
jgi:iron(III) transport system substrate-binding protein